ncbi:ribonuclease H-like domain-containing protein [Tanacetum coccineum]
MAGSDDEIPPPPPPQTQTPTPTQQAPHTVSTIKLPILKKGEYDIWAMKMEFYLAHTYYPIWEVIQRGNGYVSISTDTNGVIKMWEAIKSRFGGNDESKKMQKYILKQRFEGFFVSNSEELHKGYDRFQSLLSQLEIHGAGVSTKDVNQKFLRSLPSAWSQISLIMRTKPGVDSLSFDDLYNNHRVFEPDVEGSTALSSSTQNMAFVSENTSSTNEVSTAYGASSSSGHNPQREGSSSYTDELMCSFFANQSSGSQLDHEDLEQLDEFDLEEMDLKCQVAMISMRLKKFYKKTGRKLQFDAKEPVGFDKAKVECYNCHKTGHFARECKSKGNQDSRRRDAGYTGYKAKDSGRRPGKQEEPKALVTLDGEGVDWTNHSKDEQENYALMAYSNSGLDTEIMADSAIIISSDSSDEISRDYLLIAPLYLLPSSLVTDSCRFHPLDCVAWFLTRVSDSDSPDEMTSPEHISPLPAISPFICTDSSEAPDSSDGPPSQDPYGCYALSSCEEQDRTHLNGPRSFDCRGREFRPLPAPDLASRHASPRSPRSLTHLLPEFIFGILAIVILWITGLVVPLSMPVYGSIPPTRADHLPPRKRFRDSYITEARIESTPRYHPMTAPLVEEEVVDASWEDSPDLPVTRDGIDRIAGIETAQRRLEADQLIASGDRARMAEAKSICEYLRLHMSLFTEEFRGFVRDREDASRNVNSRVNAALEAHQVNQNLALGNNNGNGNGNNNGNGNGNDNGNGNGNNNGNGNGNDNGDGNENGNGNGWQFLSDFMKCQPTSFKGTEGVVGLIRWSEKMETMFHISNCPEKYQVKYATCTLLDSALTWWNSHKRTIGTDAAYALSWRELMKLMTEVYCPRNEIQKMETELWNLSVKNNDIASYTQRFQELTMM